MKKKVISIALAAMMLVGLLTGCTKVTADIVVNADGTVTDSRTPYYSEEEYQDKVLFDELDGTHEADALTKTTLDGEVLYKGETENSTMSWADYVSGRDGIITDDRFAMFVENSADRYDFTVTVPFSVGLTNGEKIGDHKVRFKGETSDDYGTLFYILQDESRKDGRDIQFKIADSYKATEYTSLKDKAYTNKRYVKVDSSDGFITDVFYSSYALNQGFIGNTQVGFYLEADGKQEITVTTLSGETKKISFYADSQAPTVKISKGKLVCKDPKRDGYASGIKSITVDGEKVKNNSKLKTSKKTVTVKVTDKAGNVTKKKLKVN